ncbi:hypothetical protein HYX16_00795 [Candidatus Woesearchaeota archaeon]|nr:hypothetical protein [Candidatus Woesearchaeota archaeon]
MENEEKTSEKKTEILRKFHQKLLRLVSMKQELYSEAVLNLAASVGNHFLLVEEVIYFL